MNTLLFETTRTTTQLSRNYYFENPIAILQTSSLKEIPKIFEQIEKYLKNGNYVAGYFSYECGYHFEKFLLDYSYQSPFPLIWLGVYREPKIISSKIENENYSIDNFHLEIQKENYIKNIERIKNYILEGDTYQVNYTTKLTFDFSGSAFGLYRTLQKKQSVEYAAFLETEFGGILSLSPELFFHRKNNSIITKPMKGTTSRGRTVKEDEKIIEWFRNDEKNRSENLMIVDLLRNDLGKMCEIGSIKVPQLFSVEQYETLFQMTSTIEGTLCNNISYYEIFKSIFPSGSVTGAPKIRTMQIIRELEKENRNVYCGAIGFFSPNNEAIFNVPIRTITIQNNKGVMGIGSGIVFDSVPEKEFEECILKANFLTHPLIEFQLIETILWNGKEYTFLEQHLERMKNSAQYFGFSFSKEKIVQKFLKLDKSHQKIRILLSKDGTTEIEALPLTSSSLIIKISPEKVLSTDKFLFHKITHRPLYNKYRELSKKENIIDYIFLNEKNEITEGTIHNIFIQQNGKLYTPPKECGILAGIQRQNILKENLNTKEKILTLEDLKSAEKIFVCNSVVELLEVHLKI